MIYIWANLLGNLMGYPYKNYLLEIEDYNVINIGYYNYRPRNNQVRN